MWSNVDFVSLNSNGWMFIKTFIPFMYYILIPFTFSSNAHRKLLAKMDLYILVYYVLSTCVSYSSWIRWSLLWLQLRIMLSPVIETVMLLDRLLYLQECSVSEVLFCSLFLTKNYTMIGRNIKGAARVLLQIIMQEMPYIIRIIHRKSCAMSDI